VIGIKGPTLPGDGPRSRSLYVDWPRDRSSSPGKVKNCHSSSSKQVPIKWDRGLFPQGVNREGREADQ
jgi:hypothetical protein